MPTIPRGKIFVGTRPIDNASVISQYDSLGVIKSYLFVQGFFDPGDIGAWTTSEGTVQTELEAFTPDDDGFLIIVDWEGTWIQAIWNNSSPGRASAISEAQRLLDFCRTVRPNACFGFFGLPFQVVTQAEVTSAWIDKFDLLQDLWDYVDFISPALFFWVDDWSDHTGWDDTIQQSLRVSDINGAKVIPYTYYRNHTFRPLGGAYLPGQVVPYGQHNLLLRYLRDISYNNKTMHSVFSWWNTRQNLSDAWTLAVGGSYPSGPFANIGTMEGNLTWESFRTLTLSEGVILGHDPIYDNQDSYMNSRHVLYYKELHEGMFANIPIVYNTSVMTTPQLWIPTLVNRLRLLIGDTSMTKDYTDAQLSQLIAIAGISVASEANLGRTFTFDTDIPTISPDPIEDTTVDSGISNLFVFKAACMISQGELRKDTSKFGIKIRDHLTQFDGTEGMKARAISAKIFCENYVTTKWEWEIGNKQAGRAIMGPYMSANSQRFSDRFLLDWDEDSSISSRVL